MAPADGTIQARHAGHAGHAFGSQPPVFDLDSRSPDSRGEARGNRL